MAKEWYLLKSPYDQLSGFESESFNDFGEEGFLEVLDSEVASEVEICNYDLTDVVTKKVVIQNNHQDTKLKTFSRAMLAPIGTCKAGMYVKYKDRYWLIIGIVDDNKVYEKAILLVCNYKLTWINDKGKIIQRWVNAESASQYNNGETNMIYYFVRSDQLMIYMPDDEECLMLNTGKRFIIDKRCLLYEQTIDESASVDTSNPVIVYDITRSDTVLNNYTDSGILGFIFSQTEQKESDGYYKVDGVGYWLCESPENAGSIKAKSCAIQCDSDILYIGLDPGTYTAVFYDENGDIILDELPEYSLSIECNFSTSLEIQYVSNSVLVYTGDFKVNGKSFNVRLNADGFEPAIKTIQVREFL